jgi:replicative DNA helicase
MIEIDQALPAEIGAEKIVLGAILLDTEAFSIASSILTEDSFYNEANGIIFRACKNLFDSGKPIDMLTVKKELDKMGSSEQAGGVMYLAALSKNVSSSANIEHHSMIIQQKSIQRKLISAGAEIIRMGFDETSDVSDSLDISERLIQEASSLADYSSNLRTLGSCLSESITQAQEREKRAKNGLLSGVPSGLSELDRMTTGFKEGEVVILAARPSMGKTAMMMHMAMSAAMKGFSVVVFELEMSASHLTDRMIIGEAAINSENYRNGYIAKEDWPKIEEASARIAKLPITIDDNPSVSISYISRVARKLKKQGKCDIIFIDYMGLMDMADPQKNRNREQEVAGTSRMLKILAKKMNVPIIVLSQLNRESEKSSNKEPMLSMLRDSGSIEQDADIVIFIHRPEYYGQKEDENGESLVDVGILIVAKNRNGAVGRVKFRKNESYTKIYSYTKDYRPTIPPVEYHNETLERNVSFDLPF